MPISIYNKDIPWEFRLAYARSKAQAKYRREEWAFECDTWTKLWQESGFWQHRGAKPHEYCMVRLDHIEAWAPYNCIIVTRRLHLKKTAHEDMWNVPFTEWQLKHAAYAPPEAWEKYQNGK